MKKQKDIKHIWTVVAESSVVDQQTNNISIHKVLEQLNVSLSVKDQETLKEAINTNKAFWVSFPFQVISLWQSINPKKDPTAEVEIELVDSIGQSLQTTKFKLNFQKDKTRMRSIIGSPTIRITGMGVYLFKVRIKEDDENEFSEVTEIPLEVRLIKGV